MKHFGAMFLALCAVETIGIIILVFTPPVESSGVETVTLDPGPASIGHFSVDMMGGGIISGEFESSSGRSVLFMALDDDQYEDMLADQAYDPHFSTIAPSDEFYVDYAGMEQCHIVVQHAEDTDSLEEVSVSYTVSSSDWDTAFIGMGLLGAGGILSGVIVVMRGREVKAQRGPLSPYVDVVIFDEDVGK